MRGSIWGVLGMLGALAFVGCGGSSGDGAGSGGAQTGSGGGMATGGITGIGGGSPTGGATGAGGGTPSSEVNCADYCARTTQCLTDLCEEEGHALPSALVDLLATACDSTCTEQALKDGGAEAKWDCLFESSCRALLADDVCEVDASYTCPSGG